MVFCGCHNKLPQTTEADSLTVLEAIRVEKKGVSTMSQQESKAEPQQGRDLSEGQREPWNGFRGEVMLRFAG